MIYAASLLLGAAALWLCLAPAPLAPFWLATGAGAVVVIVVLAQRMKLLDREGAPYFHAPGIALFGLSRVGAALGASLDFARLAAGFSLRIRPALVRFKTRPGDDLARATLANAIAGAPGLLVVDCDEDSILVHALIEDDGDERSLRAAETAAWRSLGAAKAAADAAS